MWLWYAAASSPATASFRFSPLRKITGGTQGNCTVKSEGRRQKLERAPYSLSLLASNFWLDGAVLASARPKRDFLDQDRRELVHRQERGRHGGALFEVVQHRRHADELDAVVSRIGGRG